MGIIFNWQCAFVLLKENTKKRERERERIECGGMKRWFIYSSDKCQRCVVVVPGIQIRTDDFFVVVVVKNAIYLCYLIDLTLIIIIAWRIVNIVRSEKKSGSQLVTCTFCLIFFPFALLRINRAREISVFADKKVGARDGWWFMREGNERTNKVFG